MTNKHSKILIRKRETEREEATRTKQSVRGHAQRESD